MGVRGLQTFMERSVPNGTVHRKILEEIENYKQKHNKNPLILIDFCALSNAKQQPQELLCGGRSQIFINKISKFLQLMVDAGAKLVFFADGPVVNEKLDTWLSRRSEDYRKQLEILMDIAKGRSLNDICNDSRYYVSPTVIQYPILRNLVEGKFGEFLLSTERECDIDIAVYANKHNAFALLADDTDFLIYPGNFQFWSTKSTNLLDGNIIVYDKTALREYLKLHENQMPLFATLIGNGYTSYDDLKSFHFKLGKQDKFQKVANYIRDIPVDLEWSEIKERIKKNIMRDCYSSNLDNKFQKSIEFYKLPIDCPLSNEKPLLEKLVNEKEYLHYMILKNQPLSVTLMFEDLTCNTLTSFGHIYQNALEKLVGVLTKHLNDNNQRKLLIKKFHNQEYIKIPIETVEAPFDVPNIENLVFGDNTEALLELRWEIFNWLFDDIFVIKSLKTLDKNYIPVIAALQILTKKAGLAVEEADVFLYCFKKMVDNCIPENLTPPANLNIRNVRVMFLFLNVYNCVVMFLHTIGLQEYAVLKGYDGVYFHCVAQKGADIKQKMSDLEELRLYDIEEQ